MKQRRVAIVTGASSGIGRALAERAVCAGWDVTGVGRRAERLDELAARLVGATGKLTTLTLDLRTPGAADRIVRTTLERFGRLDVLVNNAGGTAVGPISQQSDDALREQMETHVIVPLALTREALAALRQTRGHIFFVGSGVARIPVGTLGAYPPAKAAVRNMSRIVRNELRAQGIAVTYVDPGAVATEFMTRVGFAGPPHPLAASPYAVARKIFAGFETRRPVLNAVAWQTAFVALAEALPALTDAILRRAPQIVVGKVSPSPRVPGETRTAPAPSAVPASSDAQMPPPATPLPPRTAPSNDTPDAAAVSEASTSLESPELPPAPSPFEVALEPQTSRMRKLNLSMTFVRGLLVAGNDLELGDVALRWAGMPNKNERGLTRDVLEALANAGYVERLEAERYRVLRPAEGSATTEPRL